MSRSMNSLANLLAGKSAMKFANDKIAQAGNRAGSLLISFGTSAVKEKLARAISNDPADDEKIEGIPHWLLAADRRGRLWGVGNCGEYASVSFMHLYHRGYFPLDVMSAPNVDHQWAVLGRDANSKEDDPGTWGEACVVIDAWDDKVFMGDELTQKLYKAKEMKNIRTECRREAK